MKYPERLDPLDALQKVINRVSRVCTCHAIFRRKTPLPHVYDPCPKCGYPYTVREIAEAAFPNENEEE